LPRVVCPLHPIHAKAINGFYAPIYKISSMWEELESSSTQAPTPCRGIHYRPVTPQNKLSGLYGGLFPGRTPFLEKAKIEIPQKEKGNVLEPSRGIPWTPRRSLDHRQPNLLKKNSNSVT